MSYPARAEGVGKYGYGLPWHCNIWPTYDSLSRLATKTIRPNSASRNDRPAAFNDSTALSYPQRSPDCIPRLDHTSYRHHPSSWRPHTTATDFTYTFVIPTINRHFRNICYLAFVPFIVFGCHYSHALNLNSFAESTRLSAPQQTKDPRNSRHCTVLQFLNYFYKQFWFQWNRYYFILKSK